jgi:Tol biopolymer transport system component
VSQRHTISLIDIATGRATRVIREPREIGNPHVSPDGRPLLYPTLRHRRVVLRTVPATGGRSSFLMAGAFGTYSPDGTTIAYRKTGYDGVDVTQMTSGRVWLADADGTHPREIGHSCCWMSQIDPEALWPTWSPDGSRIAYQPLYGGPVKVVDVDRDRGRPVGEGEDPSWLDGHTLIVTGFEGTSS